ncbi:MAG: hypothetical protein ACI3XD_09700 [Oscillospiraceae bacterium]
MTDEVACAAGEAATSSIGGGTYQTEPEFCSGGQLLLAAGFSLSEDAFKTETSVSVLLRKNGEMEVERSRLPGKRNGMRPF